MMMTMRNILYLLFLPVFIAGVCTEAQDLNFDENIRRMIEGGGNQATAPRHDTLNYHAAIPRQVVTHPDTVPPASHTISASQTRTQLTMSDEALRWARDSHKTHSISPYMTFDDLVFVNPLFMPPLFKEGNIMPAEEIRFYHPDTPFDMRPESPIEPVRTLEAAHLRLKIQNMAYRYIQRNNICHFRHIAGQLPAETTRFITSKGKIKPVVRVEQAEADPTELPSLPRFIPDRRYWTSAFASDIKFSQAYISPNWHKGGSSNFNILARNQLQYNYAKNRMQMKNLIEMNASVYTTSNDSVHNYRFSEDMFRIYSNVGYKAFSKWFYTMDFEFKTPLFTNYQENTKVMQTALLSPFTINLGIGMKYDLARKFKQKDRSLTTSLNVAPVSFSYMYSVKEAIDLGRHGFPINPTTGAYENMLSKFGSTLRFDMTVKPNRNVTWKSRIYYFSSYDRIIGEFENSLDLAISRYFSTLINLHFRYDDGVKKIDHFNTFLQTNEVLSFGFSYKW